MYPTCVLLNSFTVAVKLCVTSTCICMTGK